MNCPFIEPMSLTLHGVNVQKVLVTNSPSNFKNFYIGYNLESGQNFQNIQCFLLLCESFPDNIK